MIYIVWDISLTHEKFRTLTCRWRNKTTKYFSSCASANLNCCPFRHRMCECYGRCLIKWSREKPRRSSWKGCGRSTRKCSASSGGERRPLVLREPRPLSCFRPRSKIRNRCEHCSTNANPSSLAWTPSRWPLWKPSRFNRSPSLRALLATITQLYFDRQRMWNIITTFRITTDKGILILFYSCRRRKWTDMAPKIDLLPCHGCKCERVHQHWSVYITWIVLCCTSNDYSVFVIFSNPVDVCLVIKFYSTPTRRWGAFKYGRKAFAPLVSTLFCDSSGRDWLMRLGWIISGAIQHVSILDGMLYLVQHPINRLLSICISENKYANRYQWTNHTTRTVYERC